MITRTIIWIYGRYNYCSTTVSNIWQIKRGNILYESRIFEPSCNARFICLEGVPRNSQALRKSTFKGTSPLFLISKNHSLYKELHANHLSLIILGIFFNLGFNWYFFLARNMISIFTSFWISLPQELIVQCFYLIRSVLDGTR